MEPKKDEQTFQPTEEPKKEETAPPDPTQEYESQVAEALTGIVEQTEEEE